MNARPTIGRWVTAGAFLLATLPFCSGACSCDRERQGPFRVVEEELTRYVLGRDYAAKYGINLPIEMTFAIGHGKIPRDQIKHGRPDAWRELGPDGPYIRFAFLLPDKSTIFEVVELLHVAVGSGDRTTALSELRTVIEDSASRVFGGIPCTVLGVEQRPQERRESMDGGGAQSVDSVVLFARCRDPRQGEVLACAEAFIPTQSRHGVIVASYYMSNRSPVTDPEKYELGITSSIVKELRFGEESNFKAP
jgi:hypothetical protein